jgi:hypothetical protein
MWWAAEGDRRGRISQQGDPPTLKDVFALTTILELADERVNNHRQKLQ